ncbi:hypothetical protein BT96DRAFT_946927 [Gymnopus androsaceus JB14]|uniref:Uncharacterized protein n=1 Tax=Gymnopus androsaceus JB14 TaxID=1447944 RepID=A0A6A4GVA7_9AGAR|nr:hypothetical protein BT96DRAFT_946927 [Gymnopus androsaceus JB14]
MSSPCTTFPISTYISISDSCNSGHRDRGTATAKGELAPASAAAEPLMAKNTFLLAFSTLSNACSNDVQLVLVPERKRCKESEVSALLPIAEGRVVLWENKRNLVMLGVGAFT